MRSVTLLILIGVSLAGCTDQTAETPAIEVTTTTGAIAGLLVDDRFRPLQLTDDPQSEFQATGFILLQETAERVQTNENGEFSFVDLKPGQYTLRATIGGHEVTASTVQVSAGQFVEHSILARRTSSGDGFVISNEYAAFVPCGANVILYGDSFDCTADQSGDSSRVKFTFDYSGVEATHLVMEMRSNSPEYWDVWLQPELDDSAACDETYQIMGGPETTYLRWQLEQGESAISSDTASGVDCETTPWLNDQPVQTYVYMNSLGFEDGVGFGVGVYYGVQANFVQNVFVGDHGVDVDSYCVWC